jgi:hypothetical protein
MRYGSYSFLTSAPDVVSGQRHAPAALNPRESTPGTHCIGGWVGLRSRQDTEARGKILFPCWGSNLCNPVCSETLYRLSYPNSEESHEKYQSRYTVSVIYLSLKTNASVIQIRFLLVLPQYVNGKMSALNNWSRQL